MKGKYNYTAFQLYCFALIYAALSIFLQVVPMETSKHFQIILNLDHNSFVNLASLFFITYSFMQIPGGVVFDRYGAKLVMPIGVGVACLGVGIYWYSTTIEMIVFSRLLSGIGCSVAYISGIYIASLYFPPRRLPLLIGLVEAGSTCGSLVAAKPLHYALEHWGWNNVGIAMIVFCLILFVAISYSVVVLNVNVIKKVVSHKTLRIQIFSLLTNRLLLCFFLYSFCTWLIIMSFAGYWLKYYLIDMHHCNELQALSLVEVYWGTFLVGTVLIGGFATTLQRNKSLILILAILGFGDFLIMTIPVLFTYNEIIVVVVFAGLSSVGVTLSFAIIPHYVTLDLKATALSINNTFVVLGGYSGQLLFGEAVKHVRLSGFFYKMLVQRGIETHYYVALFIYLTFSFIGLAFILLALLNIKWMRSQHL